MKTIFLALSVLVSFSSLAATKLDSFSIYRFGGGQLEAIVKSSDEGIKINLVSCNFSNAPSETTLVITDSETIDEATALLSGKAIIASDVSPIIRPIPSGTWSGMSYVIQNGKESVQVQKPIIILDGKVSDILAKIESLSRKLCVH